MLSLLIAHIIITALCLWSGMLFYKFFPVKNEPRSIIYYLFSGLILLTALTQILVLFFPINIYIKIGVFCFLILLTLYKKKSAKLLFDKFNLSSSILFFILWLIILLISAGPTIMDDTESYHIQSIKWIQEYGSVPGLANLHERFGFNSSWFSSVALFSFSSKTTGGFTVLNSVLSTWMCYWFISIFNKQYKGNDLQTAFAILLTFICCLIIWPLLRGNAANTNYDFITTCIVLVLFTEIFLSKNVSPGIEWLIWPVYLFTVSIINFPLLLLSLIGLIFFIRQKNFKILLLPIVFCLLLIVPFIIRNMIIAGYPFYPSTSFDITNADWKADPQMIERLMEYIKYFNRVNGLDIAEIKALGPDWIPSWFDHLFLFDKVLVVPGSIGLLLSIVKFVLKKDRNTILLTTVGVAWLIGWFFIAPDPRFVYGILLYGVFLFVYHFISILKNRQITKGFIDLLLIALFTASSYYFISKLWKEKEYRNWVMPASLPQPPVKEFVIDGITFRIPEQILDNWNRRCYGTPLPCLYQIDPRLRLRGKNMRSGFRLEK